MKTLSRTVPAPLKKAPPLPLHRGHLERALGNAALEGLQPLPADLNALQEVVGGKLTVSEYIAQAKERHGCGAQA